MDLTAVGTRLCRATVDGVPAAARPRVTPGRVHAGIAHLGLGAFHRAHQAVYTEDAIAAGGGDWGIVGIAPRSRDVLDAMAAQDGLYSVLTVTDGEVCPRVVAVHAELIHAAGDPLAVVRRLADPAIRVVTLTVTEKAYRLDPASGRPVIDDDVRADVATDRPPATLPGLLVRGLLARAAEGAPLAVVSCDNLPSNGRRLHDLVEAALAHVPGPAADRARDWVAAAVTFPASTVDRIVPATTARTVQLARAGLGVDDAVPVAAEPFSQWVIEDAFPAGRPAWDAVGATLTTDAEPYERLKLRMLNGVHSTLAYLGALAGCETIDHVLDLPGVDTFLDKLITADIAPTLNPPPGENAERYGATVLERFANPALGHRVLQVAMDGSQKIPQRLLGTVAERRAAGALPVWAALVLAAWIRFVQGRADDGRQLPLQDPLADRLRAAVADADGTPAGVVAAVFGVSAVFPPAFADDAELRSIVADWLAVLAGGGVAAALGAAR